MAMSMRSSYLTHRLLPLVLAGGLQEQRGRLNVENFLISPGSQHSTIEEGYGLKSKYNK